MSDMAERTSHEDRHGNEDQAAAFDDGSRYRSGKIANVSRRSFFKGLAALGAGITVLPTLSRRARAQFVATAIEERSFAAGDLSDEQLIAMQRDMLRIRWFERTTADKQAGEEGFRGYGHYACGQEAVSVGVCAALNKDDWVQSNHRSHAHAIAKGSELRKMACEITFKANGTNKGYGGSMHIMETENYQLGADGIVGPGGVIAAGAAWGLRARGKGQVAVAFGGDGHHASPYFHVALNESAVHKLPFIYVIENNQYLMNYHYQSVMAPREIADAAKGYDIPGVIVDGQDVLAVYNVMKEAVRRARAGEGPTLIQAKTYRYYDHFGTAGVTVGRMGATGLGYRSERELQHWLNRDPIDIMRRTLIEWGVMTADEADELEAEVRQEVADAFAYADESPVPKPEDGVRHVFVEGTVPARQLPETPLY